MLMEKIGTIPTIIGALESIRDRLGMGVNPFYSTLIPLLIPICMAIKNIVKTISTWTRRKYESHQLQLYRSEESDFFFLIILFVQFLLFIIIYYISFGIGVIISAYFALAIDNRFVNGGILLLFGLVGLLLLKFILGKNFKIRIRILDRQQFKWLLYAPYVIFYIGFCFETFFPKEKMLANGITISLIIVEIIGVIVFRGRYIMYKYAEITMYTNKGEKIQCDDVTKIWRDKEFVTIVNRNRTIKVKYSEIQRVEYSGDPVVILKT